MDTRQTDRDDRQANRDFDGADDLDGAVIHGEEGSAAIISGEDGVAVIGSGEGGCCYGEYHDSWEAWEAMAVVGTAMAIGTMIAQPPPAATTVVYNNTTYYVKDGTYFEQVYNGGEVAYQAVAPPPGAVP